MTAATALLCVQGKDLFCGLLESMVEKRHFIKWFLLYLEKFTRSPDGSEVIFFPEASICFETH